MDSIDTHQDSVRPIKFKEGKEQELMGYLEQELQQIETDRADLMTKCAHWVKQANSRRERKSAGPRDSNVDMPLTRERMMQNASRLQNPIFQQETIFVAKPRTVTAEKTARSVERVLDFICDQVDLMGITGDWIEQYQTFPFGVVKTPFVTEYEQVNEWREISLPQFNEFKLNGEQKVVKRKLKDGYKYFVEIEEEVVRKAAAIPEVVPFEDFFVGFNAPDPQHADVIYHRVWLSKPQMEDRVARKVYDRISVDKLDEPTEERQKLLNLADSRTDRPPSGSEYEVFEAYLAYDVNGNGKKDEIIVTFERKSMTVLRAVYNWYHAYKRPFVHHCYKPVQGTMYGVPLTYILEPIHVAYSASFNQRLDAASLANEIGLIVPPGSQLTRIMNKDGFRAAIYEANIRKDEITEIKFSQPFTQLAELESRLEQRADRLCALSDYSFGDEQTDRPTATGVIQLIEESKQPQYMMLERFRQSFADVAKHMLARYKQFFPEGLFFYVQQEEQEELQELQGFFQWPTGAIESDVLIETRVSSATMSKSVRKQELTALLDKLGEIYQTMFGMGQSALNPMDPTSMLAAQMLQGYSFAVDKMMTEFEVAGKEIMNPNLSEGINYGQTVQQLQEQIQQITQQAQQLAGQNEQLKAALAEVSGGAIQGQGLGPPPMQAPGMGGSMQPPNGPPGPPDSQAY
jgi:hypothetical protein